MIGETFDLLKICTSIIFSISWYTIEAPINGLVVTPNIANIHFPGPHWLWIGIHAIPYCPFNSSDGVSFAKVFDVFFVKVLLDVIEIDQIDHFLDLFT